MSNPPVRLKVLLREKHWQTHRTFNAEYDRAARSIDPKLVGTGPSRAQLHRWLSGELKGLPYPDHCRVLEKMLPGWTAEQLFELCPTEEFSQPTADPDGTQAVDVGQLLDLIEDQLTAPDVQEVSWGSAHRATAGAQLLASPDLLTGEHTEGISDHARTLGRKLLELRQVRRLSDAEMRELASLSGNIVELAETVDLDIDPGGTAAVVYHFDLLNLSDRPLTRVTRELWFEHTDGPLVIEPTPDSERRVAIQRIHDTSNLAKFAFQISPPLQPGDSARVGYSSTGGKFDENHYWRQSMPRYTRHYTLRVKQRNVQLGGCTATEEHPDGSENSATDSLVWDYDGDDAVMTLTRDYLRPNQAVTLRWEPIRGPA
jgi:hypothetical protein